MSPYIHQLKQWPEFQWDINEVSGLLAEIRHEQGRLFGRMEALGFILQTEATLEALTLDVMKSSEIEGELLDRDQVRSSIARRLGLDIAGLVPSDRNVDGVVEMMLDAIQNYQSGLTEERLLSWHAALFPTGRSGIQKIVVGAWRDNLKNDPMQVVSGRIAREKIHFQAPDADLVPDEMSAFIKWFNAENKLDPVLKGALAHLWFVTIHPFEDGNGRIARTIADLQLARSENSPQRFYSMSAQIRKERNAYYSILEETQQGSMDITAWIMWFLSCMGRALESTKETLAVILKKAKFWEDHRTVILNERQRFMINKVIDDFEGKLTTTKWAKLTKTSQDTALRDILDLIDKKILLKQGGSRKGASYFVNL